MAKKKKVSPKSRQRLDAQPVDPLRAGQRALLPHHVPFVDWVESGPMSDALDPWQAAESLAVTLALPIGVLLDGRYGSAAVSDSRRCGDPGRISAADRPNSRE